MGSSTGNEVGNVIVVKITRMAYGIAEYIARVFPGYDCISVAKGSIAGV